MKKAGTFLLGALIGLSSCSNQQKRSVASAEKRPAISWTLSSEPGAAKLDCLPELEKLARECPAHLPKVVIDPGHAEYPASNRSDVSMKDDPTKTPASPSVPKPGEPPAPPRPKRTHDPAPYLIPGIEHVLKASAFSQDQNDRSLTTFPEMHEGDLNLTTSLLVKEYLERCFPAESLDVELTRYPGEKKFGEYFHPDWVAKTLPPEIPIKQREVPILSEIHQESFTKFASEARIHPGLGGGLNGRVSFINYLLGSSRPWAFRLATAEELAANTIPASAYPLSSLTEGLLISIHHDTHEIYPPDEADPRRARYDEVLKEMRARPRAGATESALAKDRSAFLQFAWVELKLRSNDMTLLVVPNARMPDKDPAAADYTAPFPLSTPQFEPPMTPFLKTALDESLSPWPGFTRGSSTKVVQFYTHLGLLSGSVQTRNKILIEAAQMRGYGTEEMLRQLRKRDRSVQFGEGDARKTLDFSDVQALAARGIAVGLARSLCKRSE